MKPVALKDSGRLVKSGLEISMFEVVRRISSGQGFDSPVVHHFS